MSINVTLALLQPIELLRFVTAFNFSAHQLAGLVPRQGRHAFPGFLVRA